MRPKLKVREDMYNMEMNLWYIGDAGEYTTFKVMRVPGGWIYNFNDSGTTFVPYTSMEKS